MKVNKKTATIERIKANKAAYRRTQKQRAFVIDANNMKYAKSVDNFLKKVHQAYEISKNSRLVFRAPSSQERR